ncbi:MAG: pyruvate dehydrogenase (acetyl-transferring) E1 component subunit alpha [Simkaniaceae bacterium]
MKQKEKKPEYHFFKNDKEKTAKKIGRDNIVAALEKMLLIRNFEIRAESAYQHGKIGGFFHAYMGQEAIQTAAIDVLGQDHWWITTYRCHALALLTGVSPKEAMAELYGKITGNALGRGGSMHLYSDRMLGGFGIVGGHLPIAAGAAFSLKYQQKENEVAICFLGDGAVAQGAFHETMNLCSLWDLPCIFVIENNQWGMGTAVNRAIAVQPIAEHFAKAYEMNSYTLDGMDYFNCYEGFKHIYQEMQKEGRPILVEAVTERFRGHSISDPGLYRSKQELEKVKKRDPIMIISEYLKEHDLLSDKEYEELNEKQKEIVLEAMKFADESPWPDLSTLEEGVFA